MLCIRTPGQIATLALGGPPRTLDDCEPLKFSKTVPYRAATQISWELLAWASVDGRIHPSLTSFITTQEISGPLYMNPDVFHTQVTEYSLETFYQYKNLQ
jgi:hypothetical protein